MAENLSQQRQASATDEVEVTPEMIEAGVRAFYEFDSMPRYSDPTLREIVSVIACAVLERFLDGKQMHVTRKECDVA